MQVKQWKPSEGCEECKHAERMLKDYSRNYQDIISQGLKEIMV